MNPYNGATFELPGDVASSYQPGQCLPVPVMEDLLDREQTTDVARQELQQVLARQQQAVVVEAQVAQKLRLGERELARRSRRRR